MANEFSRKETVADYQVYAGREGSQVDFSKEAEKITTGVQAIATGREDKKAKIQSDTDDVINQLNKADSFQSQTLGQTVLLAAKGLKETLLMQSKLMKKGKISPAEFMATLQTAKDDMANWGIAAKDWNEKYNNKEARQKLDPKTQKIIASPMETAIAGHTLAFGNLDNTVPWTSPTGNVYLVKMNEDGSMPDWETQRDQYGSMNNMNNLLLYQDDNSKYDISSLIKNEVGNTGQFITATITGYTVEEGGGIVVTEEGARQLDKALESKEGKASFDTLVNKISNTVLGDELSIANILVNRSSGSDRYIIAQTEQDFVNQGGKDIKKWIRADYSTQPPSVMLEPGQEAEAKGFVEEEILLQFGQTKKITGGKGGSKDSAADISSDQKDIDDAGYISELNDAFTSPNSARSKAIIQRLIDSRNAEAKTPEERIRAFNIEPERIVVKRGGGLPDLFIDRISGTGKADDPLTTDVDESIDVLTTEDDIMSAIDILTPGKGYSRGRVRSLVTKQEIDLGDRDPNKSVITSTPKKILNVITNTKKLPSGKTLIGAVDDIIGDTTAGQFDSTITEGIDSIITESMSNSLKKSIRENFDGTEGEVRSEAINKAEEGIAMSSKTVNGKQVPVGENKTKKGKTYYKIQVAGFTEYIEISSGNPKQVVADAIVRIINSATKATNERRTKSNKELTTTFDSYTVWMTKNPGKTFDDYKAARDSQ